MVSHYKGNTMNKIILSAALALLLSTNMVQAETLTPSQEQAKKAYEAKAAKIKAAMEKVSQNLSKNYKGRGCFDMGMVEDYNTLSNGNFELGDFDAAIEWGLRGLKVQMKLLKEDDPALAHAYADMGNKYYMHKENPTATLYFKKALELYEKNPKTDPLTLADTYEMIASVFMNLDDYEQSLDYADKCLELRQKHLKKEDEEALKRSIMNIDFLKDEIKKQGCVNENV